METSGMRPLALLDDGHRADVVDGAAFAGVGAITVTGTGTGRHTCAAWWP
jgi:hypothetical protein